MLFILIYKKTRNLYFAVLESRARHKKNMKSGIFVFVFVILTNTFYAASTSVFAEENLRKKYALPTHVQLKPFDAPTNSLSGRMAPVTVFLEAFDKEKIGLICQYQPRIMDAIMMQLYRSPLKVTDGTLDLTGVAGRLITPINRALGRRLVKSVYVVRGVKAMSRGAVSRLPFNASGCKGVKDLEKR